MSFLSRELLWHRQDGKRFQVEERSGGREMEEFPSWKGPREKCELGNVVLGSCNSS